MGARVIECAWCKKHLLANVTKPGRYMLKCQHCYCRYEVTVDQYGQVTPVYAKCSDLRKVQCDDKV